MESSFRKTARNLKEIARGAEEQYRISLSELAREIVIMRIESGEARSSEHSAGVISLVQGLTFPRSRQKNPSAEIFESREQSKAKLQNAYAEVAGTIHTMKTNELLKLIKRLRRDDLLNRVLRSLPKKKMIDLYTVAPAAEAS